MTTPDEAIYADAMRYRWLKAQTNLELRTDHTHWFDEKGRRYYPSHQLSVNGTGWSGVEHLDDLLDQAKELYPLKTKPKR